MRMLHAWIVCRSGATAIEYGLLLSGVALTISGAIFFFGDTLYTFFYEDLPTALERE